MDHGLKISDPDIYAAGDCADAYHVLTGEKCWIPLVLGANRAAWGPILTAADQLLKKM